MIVVEANDAGVTEEKKPEAVASSESGSPAKIGKIIL